MDIPVPRLYHSSMRCNRLVFIPFDIQPRLVADCWVVPAWETARVSQAARLCGRRIDNGLPFAFQLGFNQ
jgi:hypothetical protein